jgi:putative DNA primase/helicase
LTIARSYRAAGEPEVCPPIGSYSDWSRTVRAPLIWLGEADPVASMETARKEDPELMSVRELFGHWRERLGMDSPCTTSEVIRVACEKTSLGSFEKPGEFRYPEFRDLLLRIAGDGGAVSSKRLGKWLSRISGRVVDGYRLVMKTDRSHGNKFSLQAGSANAPIF